MFKLNLKENLLYASYIFIYKMYFQFINSVNFLDYANKFVDLFTR